MTRSDRNGCVLNVELSRVAQQVSAPDDAAGTENRQGSDGPQAGGSSVLDVAARVELRAVEQVRFARGTARTSRWCASNTEKLIGYPAPLHQGVRTVIMIEVVTEEMHGSDRKS